MASSLFLRLQLTAPLIVCLLFIGSTASIPVSILKNVELRQQKLCQIDGTCNNCSLQVERYLLKEQSTLIQDQLQMAQEGLSPLDRLEEQLPSAGGGQCAVPFFHHPKQYCCEMWTAFDCRTRIATEECSFVGFVKYRKNLVQWANNLMLLNVCVDFDYGSEQCRQHLTISQQNEDVL